MRPIAFLSRVLASSLCCLCALVFPLSLFRAFVAVWVVSLEVWRLRPCSVSPCFPLSRLRTFALVWSVAACHNRVLPRYFKCGLLLRIFGATPPISGFVSPFPVQLLRNFSPFVGGSSRPVPAPSPAQASSLVSGYTATYFSPLRPRFPLRLPSRCRACLMSVCAYSTGRQRPLGSPVCLSPVNLVTHIYQILPDC